MLNIDQEFQNLIPPLSSEEFSQLEENLINEGCRDALVVWNKTIIDGHNRYKICTENKIPFSTKEMDFQNRDEAIEWIIRNQFGRRNLPTYMRAKLSLRLEGIIKVRAKENQVMSGEAYGIGKKVNLKSEKPINPMNTDKELAKLAGVSADTIWKTRIIENEGSEEVQAQARAGEMSINKAFKLTRKPEVKAEKETMTCTMCGKEKPISEFYNGFRECKECKRARAGTGMNAQKTRELNELFPDAELEKIYEDMKKPLLPAEESGNEKIIRNSIVTEFENIINEFNGKIKKFAYMPQIKDFKDLKDLANETIVILKTIIE